MAVEEKEEEEEEEEEEEDPVDAAPSPSPQQGLSEDVTTKKGGGAAAVVLLLVGLPGSGKTSFCASAMATGSQAAVSWTRICQDTISSGKPGSREKCLKQLEKALLQGNSNIVIDRCNLNKEQRHEFVQLAINAHADVHALVFDLPLKLCIQRATKRMTHEGGLQGKTAAATIHRMYHNKEFPCSSEGFSLITHCQSDLDVKKAMNFYLHLGSNSGPCTFECADQKDKQSLLTSLCLSDARSNEENQEIERGWSMRSEGQNFICSEKPKLRVSEGKGKDVSLGCCYSRSDLTDEGMNTLAFSSISTSDFCFDHEKAATILVGRISKFLEATEGLGLRLVLVDINRNSDMLLRVGQKASECGFNEKRFFTIVGDITKLYTDCHLQCNFIANAANWRLRGGGGGVNAAIFRAAGAELEAETKRRARTLNPGSALVVPLSEASPLRRTEGVTHVIHVLGPNMNPNRPNCLEGNYVQGCKVLDDAYTSLFECFSSIAKDQRSKTVEYSMRHSNSDKSVSFKNQSKPKNAFEVLMQASKLNCMSEGDQKMKHARQKLDKRNTQAILVRAAINSEAHMLDKGPRTAEMHMQENDSSTSEIHELRKNSLVSSSDSDDCKNKKLRLELSDEGKSKTLGICESEVFGFIEGVNSTQNPNDRSNANKMKEDLLAKGKAEIGKTSKAWGAWADGLRDIALCPEMYKDSLLQVSDDAVVIHDKYPKGKHHLLVVAREDGLDSILDLQRQHILLLEHMHSLGQIWACTFLKQDPSLVFRLGYHSDPSMRQLHMHVISQDFDSPFLKNKKHWNSFTTHFFRDSRDVIEELRKLGKAMASADEESLQKVELRCHRCHTAHPNLPRLKNHIRSCQTPYSPALMKGGHLLTISSVYNNNF